MRRNMIPALTLAVAVLVAVVGARFTPSVLTVIPLGWRVLLALATLVVVRKLLWMVILAVPYLPLAVFEANPGRHRLGVQA